MANTFAPSRILLVYAICLPLALLVGYLLADLDVGGMSVLVLLLSVLALPLLMRWHHALLVFSCNALISFLFMPGSPSLWMLMAVLSLFFSVLNRSLGRDVRFFQVPSVAWSLLALCLVVLITARLTGGIGVRSLGGATYGGRKYLTIFAGVALFFALCAQQVPPERAKLNGLLFFGSLATALVGYFAVVLANVLGPVAYYLVEFFPIQGSVQELVGLNTAMAGAYEQGVSRLGALSSLSFGIMGLLLLLFGARGVLELRRPWRLVFMTVSLAAALASGFRSSVLLFALVFGLMFYLEGLFHTRIFPAFALVALLASLIIIPNLSRFPLSMQRALAFLPVEIDPVARQNAEATTEWRVQMWEELLPQVPRYLIKGKGYALNPDDLYMAGVASMVGLASSSEGSSLAGDYHSGPLSVIIPFGLLGVIAFTWFLAASARVLRQNWKYGQPGLNRINTLLYAYFLAKIVVFIFIFGSLHSDLPVFAGIIGLSISLNGGMATGPAALEEEHENPGELSGDFAGI